MKKTRGILATLFCAAIIISLLGACFSRGQNGASQSPEDTTITVGIAQDLDDSLDPHNMNSAVTREVMFNVFEGLVKPDSSGNLVPAVAEKYELSPAGDVFTFTLRSGVHFHNGALVTADDVVYSLERVRDIGVGSLSPAFSQVKSIGKTDEKTITITLNAPSPEFLAYLTAAIIPKDYENQETLPIGTGPYQFISRTPLQDLRLRRFSDYWGDKAHISNVIFKILPSADTIVMQLNSGAVDMVPNMTADQVAGLSDDFNVLEGTMNLVQALYLNNAAPPLTDVNVRRALCYALNRAEIMDFLADGRGTPLGSSIYPAFTKYFIPSLADAYPQNILKARQLIADAGYPEGFDLTITVPSIHTPHVNTAEILSEQFKQIGVNVKIELVEWSAWLSDVYKDRKFQATVIGFDASAMTARAMLERWGSDAPNNMINFRNAEYDETLKAAIAETDSAKQVELYRRCQEILSEQAANVYIQDLCDLVALRKSFTGYEFYPLYAADMSKVRLVEGEA